MSNQISQNNKRIAKNSLMLYIRMFFIMIVTLYTSRVVLKALGVEDFGIYNVIAGVVAMFGIVSGAMSSATARFLTYELGRGDYNQLKKVFNICILIYFSLALLFVILSESVGVWFFNTQLVIPSERMTVANIVFQCSIFSVVCEMMIQPYQSLIISHEKMSLYAMTSIIEAFAKLVIAFVVSVIDFDHLLLYGTLMTCCLCLAKSIYFFYCRKHYEESRFMFFFDKNMFKTILSYSGWNLFGSSAALVKMQGLNILLNMFFNPSVNAARAIAVQVNGALVQFEQNFYTAVRPQITKYYAQNDLQNMFKLVFRSSKMSFYLVLLLAVPITVEAPYIIELWLGQLPEHVVIFTRLIIAISATECVAHPIMTSCHATGHVALYQSLVGTATILNIPISYVILKMGYPPVSVFVVSLIISTICIFMRVWVLKRVIESFPVYKYIRDVVCVCFFIGSISFIIPIFVHSLLPSGLLSTLVVCFTGVLSVLVTAYSFGLNKSEKDFACMVGKKILDKIWKK